jgi:hypothetical protein
MKEEIEGVVTKVDAEKVNLRISRHSKGSNCGTCPGDNALMFWLLLNRVDMYYSKSRKEICSRLLFYFCFLL